MILISSYIKSIPHRPSTKVAYRVIPGLLLGISKQHIGLRIILRVVEGGRVAVIRIHVASEVIVAAAENENRILNSQLYT